MYDAGLKNLSDDFAKSVTNSTNSRQVACRVTVAGKDKHNASSQIESPHPFTGVNSPNGAFDGIINIPLILFVI
jgi:hypothetical protein